MPTPQASCHNATAQQRAAFVERLFTATAGVFDLFTIYIGDRLGLYQALADHGALTATALAARNGTHARYIREWLEQQAVAGIIEVENAEAGAPRRRFRLPPGHAEVLVERDSLEYLAPLAQLVVGATRPLAAVLDAYRSGGGVPYSAYGTDVCEGQPGSIAPPSCTCWAVSGSPPFPMYMPAC